MRKLPEEERIRRKKERDREYNAKNREKRRAYFAEYRKRNPGRDREWWQNNPEKAAVLNRRKLLKAYGLTIEQYDEMLEQQGGGCAICGAPPKTKRLHVDHDHFTGEVRGILCSKCNVRLSYLEEPGWDERARAYLSRDKPPKEVNE